jgi:hypothetical protein
MTDTRFEPRDLADAWHLCALLGLTSPTAALVADSVAALLTLAALTQGHLRPACTLTIATAASACVAAVWSY